MTLKKVLKEIKSAESTISMLLGVAVVVVIGVLLFNYFKSFSKPENEADKIVEGATNEQVAETINGSLPTKYTVKAGDNLWEISENFYRSGYNWVDIARENNMKNPNKITVGQELTIPDVEPMKITVATARQASGEADEQAIGGDTYTVTKGDTLWEISVRAYQDGYRWLEIAKANEIVNPNLIHPGNTLKIPR